MAQVKRQLASFSMMRIHLVLAKSIRWIAPIGGMESVLSWSEAKERIEPSAMMRLKGPAMRPLEAATYANQRSSCKPQSLSMLRGAHNIKTVATNVKRVGQVVY